MTRSESPVLVSFTRGNQIESWHRGAVAVVGPSGLEHELGDARAPTYWRSAAKPFQTASALLAGVVDRFDLGPAEIALMCASHNGEDKHLAGVRAMLERGDLGAGDLQCGVQTPFDRQSADALVKRNEEPTVLHNNCSGKHAGMLLTCRVLGSQGSKGAPTASYLDRERPVQRRILETIARVAEIPAGNLETATDGCSAPTVYAGLVYLAIGFRNLATPDHAQESDRSTLTLIRQAMCAHPDMVAGRNRIDTALMRAGNGLFVSKIGAEGVFGCGVVDRGIGIAIKIDDGNERAFVPVMLAMLRKLGVLAEPMVAELGPFGESVLTNRAGTPIGRVEVHL